MRDALLTDDNGEPPTPLGMFMRFIEGAIMGQLRKRGWKPQCVADQPDVFLLSHPECDRSLLFRSDDHQPFGQFVFDLLAVEHGKSGVPLEVALVQEFQRVYKSNSRKM